jgi:hypothetical protein
MATTPLASAVEGGAIVLQARHGGEEHLVGDLADQRRRHEGQLEGARVERERRRTEEPSDHPVVGVRGQLRKELRHRVAPAEAQQLGAAQPVPRRRDEPAGEGQQPEVHRGLREVRHRERLRAPAPQRGDDRDGREHDAGGELEGGQATEVERPAQSRLGNDGQAAQQDRAGGHVDRGARGRHAEQPCDRRTPPPERGGGAEAEQQEQQSCGPFVVDGERGPLHECGAEAGGRGDLDHHHERGGQRRGADLVGLEPSRMHGEHGQGHAGVRHQRGGGPGDTCCGPRRRDRRSVGGPWHRHAATSGGTASASYTARCASTIARMAKCASA